MNTRSPAHRPRPAHATQINPILLDRLLCADGPVTIETLALQLDCPARIVLEEVDALRTAGCRIDSHPQHGLTLAVAGLPTWADYLRWCNRPRNDRVIEVYAKTTSTQDAARRIVMSCGDAADKALVVADEQTSGRGRLGRRWIAPPGTAVTFSRVVFVEPVRLSVDRLTLVGAVAVAKAIEPWLGPGAVQIKWPNDLLVAGKKVSGILVETFTPSVPTRRIAAIIGVGINVTLDVNDLPPDMPELRDRVTSVHQAGRRVDRLLVLRQVLAHMDELIDLGDDGPALEYWRGHCPLLSQRLRVRHAGRTITASVVDLDPTAGLIVQTGDGALIHLPAATTTIL